LEPHLGVMKLGQHSPCIIADIPGLIEGAHAGAGLGHKFLKHIERTRVLLHVLDGAKPIEEIIADQQTLEQELRRFDETLLSRRKVIVLNKMDLLEDMQQYKKLAAIFAGRNISVLAISALTGSGIEALKQYLVRVLEEKIDE
jgi:GTP-binding protein